MKPLEKSKILSIHHNLRLEGSNIHSKVIYRDSSKIKYAKMREFFFEFNKLEHYFSKQ